MNNVEHLTHVSRSMEASWDSARSRRVFEGALRSRAARGRRQRLVAVACAASAALFVFGIRSAGLLIGSPHLQSQQSYENASNAQLASGSSASLSSSNDSLAGGAISMNSDMFADGGREAD